MLHINQVHLLFHLARFNQLAYEDCLAMLDEKGTGDRTALSYAFRPLTKNGYVSKRKDGCVTILAKGRELFPDVTSLISTGGGEQTRKRVMEVSRMAALMEKHGIYCMEKPPTEHKKFCFIPSACWREIATGILSTTRFNGILVAGKHRLAVYDIGDGNMEWQVRAEGSLFYTQNGSYKTKATGMLFVCREDARIKAAQGIIRQTMWHRRQLLREKCVERTKPTKWSRSPIKLKAEYEHVYLTTPERLEKDIWRIVSEDQYINALLDENNGVLSGSMGIGDIEAHPRRLFVNPACDLLKYVRFFSAVKTYLAPVKEEDKYRHVQITLEIYVRRDDLPIVEMYPDLNKMEGWKTGVYRS